jgi:hypothetical protein
MNEAKLREKLARIEARSPVPTTDGECIAAADARKRIQLRLQVAQQHDAPVEVRPARIPFSTGAAA